jgi:hypothetical protein
MVPLQYFDNDSNFYLTFNDWGKLWKQALGTSYKPMIFIKAISEDKELSAIPEILKYAITGDNLFSGDDERDIKFISDYYSQSKNIRNISTAGIIRKYLADFQREINSQDADLIGHTDEGLPVIGSFNTFYSSEPWVKWDKAEESYTKAFEQIKPYNITFREGINLDKQEIKQFLNSRFNYASSREFIYNSSDNLITS